MDPNKEHHEKFEDHLHEYLHENGHDTAPINTDEPRTILGDNPSATRTKGQLDNLDEKKGYIPTSAFYILPGIYTVGMSAAESVANVSAGTRFSSSVLVGVLAVAGMNILDRLGPATRDR